MVSVNIAFNQIFYGTVYASKKEVIIDGCILSANFEFTELEHSIDYNKFDHEELHKWIVFNSAHLIDTTFYLIGEHNNMYNMISGEGLLTWYSSGNIFIGISK
jgi:hypothetical protein